MENAPTPKPYKLYEDEALLAVSETDYTLSLLLQGLKGVELMAAERPDEAGINDLVKAAEEGVRYRIRRQGYKTSEGLPDEP